jgi:hypothetical protein
MTVKEVIQRWASGEDAECSNLKSIGGSLYSYKTEVARILGDNLYLTNQGSSATTTKHINLATSACKKKIILVDSEFNGELIIP